jgi:hypothetical protein
MKQLFFLSILVILIFIPESSATEKEPAWGCEYTTAEESSNVKRLLVSMCEGPESPYYKSLEIGVIILGPSIIPWIDKTDPWFKSYVLSLKKKREDDGRKFVIWETTLFKEFKVSAAKKSPALKQLARAFVDGNIRAATTKEREHISYFEYIRQNTPISVVEKDSKVLLIWHQDGGLIIEMLSAW